MIVAVLSWRSPNDAGGSSRGVAFSLSRAWVTESSTLRAVATQRQLILFAKKSLKFGTLSNSVQQIQRCYEGGL